MLARAGKRQDNYTPKYAPTGARILFNRVTYGIHTGFVRSDLLIINAAGRSTNITRRTTARFFSPNWAPDGNAIVAVRGATMSQIVSMTPSGGDVRLLATLEGGGGISSPTYSPDGSKIAFLVCDGDCGDPLVMDEGVGSIWVMNADGSNAHAIFEQMPDSSVQPFGTLDWGVGP